MTTSLKQNLQHIIWDFSEFKYLGMTPDVNEVHDENSRDV